MSMTAAQYQTRLNDDQRRAIQSMLMTQTRQIIRGCKTDDEKYERVRDATAHDMIWSMTHGPR